MLTVTIPGQEFYNEVDNSFSTVGDITIELEHSLVSLSKWESKYQTPFLGPGAKTTEQTLGYIEAMILTPNVPENILSILTEDNFAQINDHIESSQTATTFHDRGKKKGRSETVTSELIYFWMVSYNIPFTCETWHLNRLFSLIRVCEVKNSKPKKMSRSEIAQRNQELNAQRRAQLGTTG